MAVERMTLTPAKLAAIRADIRRNAPLVTQDLDAMLNVAEAAREVMAHQPPCINGHGMLRPKHGLRLATRYARARDGYPCDAYVCDECGPNAPELRIAPAIRRLSALLGLEKT